MNIVPKQALIQDVELLHIAPANSPQWAVKEHAFQLNIVQAEAGPKYGLGLRIYDYGPEL